MFHLRSLQEVMTFPLQEKCYALLAAMHELATPEDARLRVSLTHTVEFVVTNERLM